MNNGKQRKRHGMANLVKYSLTVDGKRLLLTSDELAEIQSVKNEMEENNPSMTLAIENFGVRPDPKTSFGCQYRDFKKVRGYSLWQVLK